MNWAKSLLLSAMLAFSVWAGQPVNVNTASAEQIAQSLVGVGLSKAQAIVEYRNKNGLFQHPDELVKVKGIGLKTVDKNRDLIRVESPGKKQS